MIALIYPWSFLLRITGLVVLGPDGARASRLRATVRALATWLPLAVVWPTPLVLKKIFGVQFANDMPAATAFAVLVVALHLAYLAAILWSLRHTDRGPAEILSGTRIARM